MPTPNAFALMLTSALISVGIVSSLSQMGVVLYLFGKHGFIIETSTSGDNVFRYLSDTFALSPGLANAWLISMIPSVAVAAIIINTSLARDLKRSYNGNYNIQFVNTLFWIFLWLTVLVTHIGLMMLVLYNIQWKKGLHIVGVILCVVGGLLLNAWVGFLDYGVTRRRWHPQIVFDTIIVFVTVLSVFLFSQYDNNVSVLGEWVLLVIVMIVHAIMPIRGARIVFSTARPRRNTFGCVGEVDCA
jgi:hypothetical protein